MGDGTFGSLCFHSGDRRRTRQENEEDEGYCGNEMSKNPEMRDGIKAM